MAKIVTSRVFVSIGRTFCSIVLHQQRDGDHRVESFMVDIFYKALVKRRQAETASTRTTQHKSELSDGAYGWDCYRVYD